MEEVLKGERKRKNEGYEVYGRRRKRRRERKGELYGEVRGGQRGREESEGEKKEWVFSLVRMLAVQGLYESHGRIVPGLQMAWHHCGGSTGHAVLPSLPFHCSQERGNERETERGWEREEGEKEREIERGRERERA